MYLKSRDRRSETAATVRFFHTFGAAPQGRGAASALQMVHRSTPFLYNNVRSGVQQDSRLPVWPYEERGEWGLSSRRSF